MKTLLSILILTSAFQFSFGQGTFNTANTTGTAFRTNNAFDATSGNTAPTLGGFYFEVLTAPSTVTSIDLSLHDLLSAPWSDTGLRMTNTSFASGGRMNGPSGANGIANNWGSGIEQSFVVVGWSANLGTTWAQASTSLTFATFSSENGGNYFEAPITVAGYIGASTVQAATSGQPNGVGAFSLFGTTGNAGGTPITTPTTLYLITNSPEPSFIALLGFGVCALIGRRARRI